MLRERRNPKGPRPLSQKPGDDYSPSERRPSTEVTSAKRQAESSQRAWHDAAGRTPFVLSGPAKGVEKTCTVRLDCRSSPSTEVGIDGIERCVGNRKTSGELASVGSPLFSLLVLYEPKRQRNQ